MKTLARLFSFRGRTARLAYWRIQLGCTLALAVVWTTALVLADTLQQGAFGAAGLVPMLPVAVAGWAAAVRRLHDRGKSGWWLLAFSFLPLILSLGIQETEAHEGTAGPLTLGLALVDFVLLAWGFVEIGLLRGTSGANPYGPALAPAN